MNGISIQSIVAENEDVPDVAPGPRQDCSNGLGKFDEQFHLIDCENGVEMRGVDYRITASTGEVFEGTTNANGFTERIFTIGPAKLKIEVVAFDLEGRVDDE
ncbi:hypothetical protein [Massilia suwonensis]|uniref:Uncharacterized protein n=1 Tax=Massilia suwonensis TaxID=648895 RepID=A0ABW0MR74_9BURK